MRGAKAVTDIQSELLATVIANPDDILARLILADWLEENGVEPERAEFIRVQVEIEAWNRKAKESGWLAGKTYGMAHDIGTRRMWLCRREKELLAKHWTEWAPRFPDTESAFNCFCDNLWTHKPTPTPWVQFRNGFPDHITLPLEAWCGLECQEGFHSPLLEMKCPHCHGSGRVDAHGPAIVRATPVRDVRFVGKEPSAYPVTLTEYWGWFRGNRDGNEPMCVPVFLWELMLDEIGRVPAAHWLDFPTPEAAYAALSRAAILWANRTDLARAPGRQADG